MSEKIKFTVYPNHVLPYEPPYKFVVAATQENIDVRLGSMGLTAFSNLSCVERLFLSLFLENGTCLCVEETMAGVDISIKHKKPCNT
jgi:hypothetical protein